MTCSLFITETFRLEMAFLYCPPILIIQLDELFLRDAPNNHHLVLQPLVDKKRTSCQEKKTWFIVTVPDSFLHPYMIICHVCPNISSWDLKFEVGGPLLNFQFQFQFYLKERICKTWWHLMAVIKSKISVVHTPQHYIISLKSKVWF